MLPPVWMIEGVAIGPQGSGLSGWCVAFDDVVRSFLVRAGGTDLARTEAVPANFLAQILGKLRAHGLITSRRGNLGGYKLSRAPDEISLYDIMMATDMDYDSIAKAGSMLGSGAVIVMDETRCMVKSLLRLSYFYMHESCGQCTPCREGTGWLWRVIERIEHGKGRPEDLDLLNSVADNIQGRTICALGDAAAMPVRAFIKHFRDEFAHHIEHKTCAVPQHG